MLNTRSLKGKQIMQFWSPFLAFPAKGFIHFGVFFATEAHFFEVFGGHSFCHPFWSGFGSKKEGKSESFQLEHSK